MRTVLISISLFLIALTGAAQKADSIQAKPDTLLMNDGGVVVAKIVDTSGFTVDIIRQHKHRKIEIDKNDIFQITYGATGKQVILYVYDSLVSDHFTITEARRFIAGEQDARRGYHVVFPCIVAFGLGTGSALFDPVLSIPAPLLFAGLVSLHKHVKVNRNSVCDTATAHTDSYLRGYSIAARQKRVRKTFLWGAIGVVFGIVLDYTIFKSL
jgi:hypothetical protein